jgi:hypothetical protein
MILLKVSLSEVSLLEVWTYPDKVDSPQPLLDASTLQNILIRPWPFAVLSGAVYAL